MKNLDALAARTAHGIIDETKVVNGEKLDAGKVDNLITKALGVLQENGVYAAMLYLYSRTEKNDKVIAEKARQKLLSLLPELGITDLPGTRASEALPFVADHVCDNLDRLLLVKQLWEQTLIYARYGAKARGVESPAGEGQS